MEERSTRARKMNYDESDDSRESSEFEEPIKIRLTLKPQADKRKKKKKKQEEDYDDENYDIYDEGSDDDIIPTPALDDEGLTDDEQNYQPDVSKMTERQRAKLLDEEDNTLVSLSNKAHSRKILTAEEIELKKAENARKRKNMLEKKLDEEKQDTINKLLKRRAVKTGTRSKKLENDADLEGIQRERPRRPQLDHPALLRWTSTKESITFRVPQAF